MFKKVFKGAFSLYLSFTFCFAEAQNFISLKPTDTEAGIVRKAAGIVPSARQLRWQQLELTAFFHFGVNTFTNKEWGDGTEYPAIFNPTELDAKQWVKTMKDAGFKQVIITAKHHDGFCLWPSKYTEHSVKNSPYKNGNGDVVKEVDEACKLYNIGFGVYLSPWDRNSPMYGDKEKYNAYFVNQLTELLTQYGKVDEVWFDGANGEGPNGKKQVYDFDNWYKLIRKLQPSAVIAIMGPDVRWVGTESGYGRETEWSVIPMNNLDANMVAGNSQTDIAFKPAGDMMGDDLGSRNRIDSAKGLVWYPAETDVSIRPGWFYHPAEDTAVKSAEELMNIYFASAGRNSVLLLNVPPNTNGLISDSDVKTLQAWKAKMNKTFSVNMAKGAFAKGNITVLTDNKISTFYTTKDTAVTIEFTLTGSKTFNVLLLQENIAKGQRVEKFTAEYWAGNEWKQFTSGTTIGYKRLLKFDAVTAKKVRLKIESSRLNPYLAEVGLYKLEK